MTQFIGRAEVDYVVNFDQLDRSLERSRSKVVQATNQMANTSQRATGRMQTAFTNLGERTGALRQRFTLLRGAVAGFVGVLSVREIVRYADAFKGITNQISQVTTGTAELKQVTEGLFDIAFRTRQNIEGLADVYQRGSLSADELGASQKDLLQFTELVGKSLATQRGGAESASGALLQLGQLLGSTNIRAEEFNSLQEGALPILQAVARGIDETGGSVARLRELVLAGEVTNREFFQAFLSQSEAINETFSKTSATVGQAMTVLRNSLTEAIGGIDQTAGGSERLAGAIIGIAEAVRDPAFQTFVTNVLEAGATAISAFVEGLGDLQSEIDRLRGGTVGDDPAEIAADENVEDFVKLNQELKRTDGHYQEVQGRLEAVREGQGTWLENLRGEGSLEADLIRLKERRLELEQQINDVLATRRAPASVTPTGTAAAAAALEGRQHGGPVEAGEAYVVGEAGPEIFVPTESGEIVPISMASFGNVGGAAKQAETGIKGMSRALGEASISAQTLGSLGARALLDIADGTQKPLDALDNLLDTLAQIVLQVAITSAIAGAFGGGSIPLFGSAKGNVFRGGRIQPFARGGVLKQPTVFPMAHGMGLAGEAGPEAILPLKRLAGGNLGVQAQVQDGGGSGGVTINYSPDLRGAAPGMAAAAREEIVRSMPLIMGEVESSFARRPSSRANAGLGRR